MLDGEDGEREIPLRITNIELAKLVKEQMAESRAVREENRNMRRELEKLQGKLKKGNDYESEGEEVEGDTYGNEIPLEQRPLLQALERVGAKGGDIPMFHGRLNPDECLYWIEALDKQLFASNHP